MAILPTPMPTPKLKISKQNQTVRKFWYRDATFFLSDLIAEQADPGSHCHVPSHRRDD